MKPETECFLVRKHAEKLYEERQEFPLLMFRRFLPFQAHGIRKTFNCSRQCTKSTEARSASGQGMHIGLADMEGEENSGEGAFGSM